MKKYKIYFISDSTGITAETLGHSLLTQFEDIKFDQETIPYVNSENRAKEAIGQIERYKKNHADVSILIFSTLVCQEIRDVFAQTSLVFLDFFSTCMSSLENALNIKPNKKVGASHAVINTESYEKRINAINFTLNTDDGVNFHQYNTSDVILLGVSRSGKTPTCLYLALQFGILASNYPITEEDDFAHLTLPLPLSTYVDKLYGLTIDPVRLHSIRTERIANSGYASLQQCQFEIYQVEQLYKKHQIPFINSTNYSIEEISTKIIQELGIKRYK
jgi:hypothetical protein